MAHFLEESSTFDSVSALLNRSIQGCRFQFFSTEQAQSVSVVRITRSDAFDELGRANSDGLHDSRMGVTQISGQLKICPTCQMTAAQGCPGHLGHIQLHTEVYNPFLFPQLLKLLQLTCTHCGKFRCGKAVSAHFVRIFSCLARGKTPPELHDSILTNGARHALEYDASPGWEEDENTAPLCMLWEDHITGKRKRLQVPYRSAAEHRELAQNLHSVVRKNAKGARKEWNTAIDDIVNSFPVLRDGDDAMPSFLLEQWRLALKQFVGQSRDAKTCKMCKKPLVKFRKEGNTRIYQQDNDVRYFCTPTRIRSYVRNILAAEPELMAQLYPGARDAADQFFFVETVLVTPNCFRPLAGGADTLVLAMETRSLIRIMEANDKLAESLRAGEGAQPHDGVAREGAQPHDGVALSYVQLQEAVNCYYDSSKGATKAEKLQKGIRQVLERKEGLFRSKMMGKRVNFAARSVISPDNNLEGYEIGLPLPIVKTLAYPEPVTMYNVPRMRQLVENGMDVYPGASYVLQLSASGENRCIDLQFMNRQKRQALAQKLLVGLESGEPPFVVYRNLVNGDPVLMNRQPTLHKPGIMAHKVRVLHSEKTIRMHYVNCNTYNADFDGDEMNCHAPQDPLGRIEALSIACTDNQYLVPTSGKPVRGLIQDHVVGGVFLCARDTFLTQSQASHLLYKGLFRIMEGDAPKHLVELSANGVHRPRSNPKKQFRFCWDEPCIMKPKRWSGKQILSMVLKSLLRVHGWPDNKMFHVSKSKTPGDMWNGALDGNKEEENIVIRGTELLCGVLDKSQFGHAANGLVHTCYEIFGPAMASRTLSVFAKLFTAYLQMTGFTCAMSDFLVNKVSDGVRTKLIQKTHIAGAEAIVQFSNEEESKDQEMMTDCATDLSWKLKKILATNPRTVDLLDGKMKSVLSKFCTETISACLPSGQLVPFPKNCFATMVQTGAKGTHVNHSQISCMMGQQELEGRRVPFLSTRRSLPSFAPFDYGARAGGYITDRFLTGIRPQEFFFHCMAGREGLVDTAVKTSRSGYLQRCLVKHLETLVMGYDHTVRDISDDSVIQFLYGEDGCDVVKTAYLTQFDVAQTNPSRGTEEALTALRGSSLDMTGIAQKYREVQSYAVSKSGSQNDRRRKVMTKLKEVRELCRIKKYLQVERHVDFVREHLKRYLDADTDRWKHAVSLFMEPTCSVFTPSLFFGATSEKYEDALKTYLSTANMSDEEKTSFRDRMHLRFQKSLCAPGEAVGILAAQGMGEPSTQMTLNTFHLAGHGGANVTLGIPRLREIVQTAAKKIMTPTMKIFFLQTPTGSTDLKQVHEYASSVAQRYSRTSLKDLIRKKCVNEVLRDSSTGRKRTYHITLEFDDWDAISKRYPYVTRQVIKETMCVDGSIFKVKLTREVSKLIAIAKAGSESGIQKGGANRVLAVQDVANVAPEPQADDQEDGAPPPKKRKVEKNKKTGRRTGVGSDVESVSSEEDVTDGESGDEEEKDDVSMGVQDSDDGKETGFVRECSINGTTFVGKVVVSVTDSPAKMLLSELVSLLLDSIHVQDPTAVGLNTLRVMQDKKEKVYVETEGVNMHAFWCLPDGCVCTDSIYTNCISSMVNFYGVESCRQSIVTEIRNLFNAYGIEVNYRHLFLVADYMTHTGKYRACNRSGIQDAASPFLQMSYETSMNFCTTATIEGLVDTLTTPTGSIVIGSAPPLGSNAFSILSDLNQKPRESGSKKIFTFK